MATPKTITIDASNAASGIDLETYFATYFSGLKTGTSSYYGAAEPDPDPYGYQHGTQVGFRYTDASGADTTKQVLIEGENLAYDGATGNGHGNSGTIDTVSFGTRADALPPGPVELTDMTAELVITGWDLTSAPGLGPVPSSPVYQLYNALRKAGTDAAHITTIKTVLGEYAQDIRGSQFADTLIGSKNDDTISGGDGDDFLAGGGGSDVIDGGAGTDTIYFDGIFGGTGGTYSFTSGAGGAIIITDTRADGTGVDTLTNFEILKFKNLTYDFRTHRANYTPTDLALDNASVEGDVEFGTVVSAISATDQDAGDIHTFSLVNDADGRFFIEGNLIKATGTLTDEDYTVRVRVIDRVGNVFEKDLTIDVTNPVIPKGSITIDASGANGMDFEAFIRGGFASDITAPSYPVFDNSLTQVAGEEMFIGYGATSASKYVFAHSDALNGLSYDFSSHVVSGTINTIEYGTRGNGSFDATNGYFSGGTVQLRITGLSLSNAGNDSNGPVHHFAAAYMYGSAGASGSYNAYADALDDYAQNFIGSAGNDRYVGTRYSDTISGGAGNDTFIATQGNDIVDGGADNDRVIFSGAKADYTVTRLQDGSYTIALKNGKGTTNLKNVETAMFSNTALNLITGVEMPVGDPPKDLALSASAVLENAEVGTKVGDFSAVDPEGKTLTFSLVDDAGGRFELTGKTLRVKGGLDYETSATHKITLGVVDADGHEVFKDFIISVGNVDEVPESISISKSLISEGAEIGTRVGMLSAIDPEGGNVTYSLIGNPGSYFKLTADGKLILAKALDYEKKQSHTITVQAKDAAGNVTTQAIKIDVDDVLESKAGTARNDVLNGTIGRDKLSGGAGNDKLSGGGGDDKLYGGSGNDKLTGGMGADDLWGGSGADTFIFKSIKESTVNASGRDTIFDFSARQKDKIDLSGIDANTTKGGNQAFSFIGTKAFSGKAGELRYEKAKSDTYVYGDVNGDKIADFAIHLDDRVNLSKSYFIL